MSESLKENLRPAIKSPVMTGEGKIGEKVARRVNFPADDSLVTGYLEPPNPWAKAYNVTSDDLIHVYKAACENLHIKPINKVIQQLQQIESISTRVQCLSLKGEKLDHRHYEALEEIFKRVQFETIDVESTNLDEETSVALFDMIEYYESARNLNIAFNKNLNLRSWQACARMLKRTRSLESLDARSTHLSEHVMTHLCRTLRAGSNLTTLHLENCNVSGRTCTLLMTALKVNYTLCELYLADNKLNATDALQIGNLLRSNSRLKYLDLKNNHIMDAGVGHLVDGLNDQSMGPGDGLQTLILWSNQLTFGSTAHIAKAVATCRSLLTLNLGCNNITNEGVFHLKESLMKNRTLLNLGLHQTKITCEGAVALAEYIADNPSIQTVDLRENNIKIAGLLALSLSMKVNRSVTRLDLDKDPKKETNKDLQDQHQRLLLEIISYCERNYENLEQEIAEEEKEKEKEEAIQKTQLGEDREKLSESVCRLLSLFEPAPKPKSPKPKPLTTTSTNILHQDQPPSSPTPTIILPDTESKTVVTLDLSKTTPNLSPVNPALLSPPAVCPSPPKSRFRVSRVSSDSDSLLSTAGSTPMPSPVPSPGHTPFASPGCTPFASPGCSPYPSPLSSPMGSPLSSPFRNGFSNGITSYLNTPSTSKVTTPKCGLLADPLKKRALKTWNSSPNLPRSSENLRPVAPVNVPDTHKSVRSLFPEMVPAGTAAPPSSPATSDSGVGVVPPLSAVPPNTPDDAATCSSWSDDTGDLSELRISCGSESWMDSLSDGLLSGGSSPTSESCPSLSSYSNVTPLTSPNPSVSTGEELKERGNVDQVVPSESISIGESDKWSLPPLMSSCSPVSVVTSDTCSVADSGVATPDSELSSATGSLQRDAVSVTSSSMDSPFVGVMAPPCSPIGILTFDVGTGELELPVANNKRALSPSNSQNGFEDSIISGSRFTTISVKDPESPLGEGLSLSSSPTSPSKPFRKKKKTENETCKMNPSSSSPSTKIRDIKLAEPSCVRLFGGGVPSGGGICPRQSKDLICDFDGAIPSQGDPQDYNTELHVVVLKGGNEEGEEGCDMERKKQIEELKKSLEEAKVLVGRRASTGSAPVNTKGSNGRRTSTMVDELIQKQLLELQQKVCKDEEKEREETETANDSDNSGTVMQLSVKVDDEIGRKSEGFSECLGSDETSPITVTIVHGDLSGVNRSPVRQRLVGGESQTPHLLVSPQCRSIGPGDILQLFEDFNDRLPTIDQTDILARPNQESTTAETLKI